jgi:hypothetical protein
MVLLNKTWPGHREPGGDSEADDLANVHDMHGRLIAFAVLSDTKNISGALMNFKSAPG